MRILYWINFQERSLFSERKPCKSLPLPASRCVWDRRCCEFLRLGRIYPMGLLKNIKWSDVANTIFPFAWIFMHKNWKTALSFGVCCFFIWNRIKNLSKRGKKRKIEIGTKFFLSGYFTGRNWRFKCFVFIRSFFLIDII